MVSALATGQHPNGYMPVAPGLILALPLAGALLNGCGAFLWRRNRLAPSLIGPLAIAAAFVVVVLNFFGLRAASPHAPEVVPFWTWMAVGTLKVRVAVQLDQLSMVMMLIVTGVSTIIHVYSVGYMREDPGYSRYFSYLNLFVFFMLLLVMGSSFPVTFVGWEGVGLCSYLLIGFWYENREFSNAGKKAFIVNRIGDFGFLTAMFLIFVHFGSLDYSSVFAAVPSVLSYGGVVVTLITLLLFLGCVGKSAQIPLYVWLPDAMAGPTPVSALIHAATMVTAGVYLVARCSILFAMAPTSSAVVASIGAATALFAATIATQQYDIKKVLAYSTISQLGYMFLAVGVGAFTAGIFHLMTHAFFKALLFLGAGAVIHSLHHVYHALGSDDDANDMRNAGGLKRWMPITWLTMWVATLAIAGVFPFAGFFSKDEIIWAASAHGFSLLWIVALLTAFLTAAYMTRLMVLTFHGHSRVNEEGHKHLHEVPVVMWVPLVLLAVLSGVGGWLNTGSALPVPHVEALQAWLEPVFAPAFEVARVHGIVPSVGTRLGVGEAGWAVVSVAVAAVVILLTFRALVRQRYVAAVQSPEPTGLAGVLYHKWYVDEMYDRLIVRPLLSLWRGCWRIVDAGIIDGSVNGLARAGRAVGWIGGQLQTGRVGTYIAFFVIGAVVILWTIGF